MRGLITQEAGLIWTVHAREITKQTLVKFDFQCISYF